MANRSKLASLRKEANLDQKDLGDFIGVTRETVSKWERNIARPTAEHIIAICNLLSKLRNRRTVPEDIGFPLSIARAPDHLPIPPQIGDFTGRQQQLQEVQGKLLQRNNIRLQRSVRKAKVW